MFEDLFKSWFSRKRAKTIKNSFIIRLNSENINVPGSINSVGRESFVKAKGKIARYEFYFDVTNDQLLLYAIVNENLRDKLRAKKMLWLLKKKEGPKKLNSSGFQNEVVKISLNVLKQGIYVVLGDEKNKELKVSDYIKFVSEA